MLTREVLAPERTMQLSNKSAAKSASSGANSGGQLEVGGNLRAFQALRRTRPLEVASRNILST